MGSPVSPQYQDDQLIRPMSLQMFQSASSTSSVTNIFESLPWDRRQGHFGVTYQVPLYTGGRLSSEIDVASLAADQAALLVTGNTWELRANVVMLYSGAQALHAVSAAVAQHQKSLEMTRCRLRLMVDHGKRPRLDLLKVDEELQATIAQRSSVVADETRLKALLLALIGREAQTPLAIDPLTEKEPQLKMDETRLASLVLDTSPVCRAGVAERQAKAGVAATISAPFDGVVAARLVDRGDLATPGKPLLRFLPVSGIRVRVKVPPEALALLKQGAPVICLPEGGEFETRIARVFPSADSTGLGTFEAEVPVDAPHLIPRRYNGGGARCGQPESFHRTPGRGPRRGGRSLCLHH